MAQMLQARLAETVAQAATCQPSEEKHQAPRSTQVVAVVVAHRAALVVQAVAAIVIRLAQLIQVVAAAERHQQVAQDQQVVLASCL